MARKVNNNKGKGDQPFRKDERDDQNTKGKRRGTRNNRKPRGGGSTGPDRPADLMSTAAGTLNDPSWYTQNPGLTLASASIPFPYRPGMELPVWRGDDASSVIHHVANQPKVPGIAVLHWAPAIGRALTVTDPINVAAKELFSQVRATFSGSIEADAPDFIIYLMALDSIYAYIGGLKRIYTIISQYSPNNYLVPEGLLRALGFTDLQILELQSNKMEFYGQIQQLIGMVQKFMCPAVFPVFARHYWLNENVYTDSDTANSQWYVFNMDLVYRYELQDIGEGIKAGGLTAVDGFRNWTGTGTINDQMFTRGLELIQALASSDDAYIISGYLQRAFQGAPTFGVNPLEMGATFTPVFEPAVLMQIENSFSDSVKIQGGDTYTDLAGILRVKQDPHTNTLQCPLSVAGSLASVVAITNPVLNIRSDAPGSVDVVESTRLITMRDPDNEYFITGTEFVIGWAFPDTTGATGSNLTPMCCQFRVDDPSASDTNVLTIINHMARIAAFDWHPRMMVFNAINGEGDSGTVMLVWDQHNMTVLSHSQLEDINRVCLYSLFESFTM